MTDIVVPSVVPHKEPPTLHAKPVTMLVEWHAIAKTFKVVETTNSIYYLPGEIIPSERIALINESGKYPNWTIRVVNHDYLQAVMGLLGVATQVATSKVPIPPL